LFLGGEKVRKGELAKEGKSIQIDPPFLLNILYKRWHIGDGDGLGRAYYHPPTRKTKVETSTNGLQTTSHGHS
jgi:hypothetical protein